MASAELALLAGADRVEGTLFGNGERAEQCGCAEYCLQYVFPVELIPASYRTY